jgi:phosphatidylinositol alpha-1,6-mannosyltransferase
MQRLSKDLDRELSAVYKERYRCCHPARAGLAGLMLFAFRAFARGVITGWRGGQVHLGDLSLAPLGALVRLCGGARISATACGLDVVYPSFAYQWLIRISLPFIDRIACISHATMEQVKSRGAKDSRIVVIPCGIRTNAAVMPATDPPALISVGRLIPRKGIAWFLEHVFTELHQQYPALRYVIIGKGPDEKKIRSIVHAHALGDSVAVKTDCTDDERDRLLSTASIFVMPNISIDGDMEGFGIACIEASARGVPVAASDIGGIPDAVIVGKTGIVFLAQDSHKCIQEIGHLLAHPLHRQAVAEATRAHYSWDTMINLYRTHVFR